jgi:hypothetical protein
MGLVAGAVVALSLAVGAYGSAFFADAADDANEAPDISSVTVDDAGSGPVRMRIAFANFQVLPADCRVLLRLDLDRNEQTGSFGDEITVRYSSNGTLELFRWNGSQLAAVPATGMSATLANGVLVIVVDRAHLAGAASYGVIAVAARTQSAGIGLVTATDFAPGSGRSVYSAPGPVSFPDPNDDQDVAADITSIAVTDTPAGRVQFELTTANYGTLPPDKLIGIGIDIRGRPDTDDFLSLGYLSGDRVIEVDREERGNVQPIEQPAGITGSHADGVLTVTLPRRHLDGASAFDFGIVSADLVGPGESEGEEFEGEVEALDTAPEGLTELYSYRLANPGRLQLRSEPVVGRPALPRAGRPFTVAAAVRRLDTYRLVRSGTVSCVASVGGSRVSGRGRFRGGRAECTLRVPPGTSSRVLRGTLTARTAGASVRQAFRFVVD